MHTGPECSGSLICGSSTLLSRPIQFVVAGECDDDDDDDGLGWVWKHCTFHDTYLSKLLPRRLLFLLLLLSPDAFAGHRVVIIFPCLW